MKNVKIVAMALTVGAMLGAWADYKAESKNACTWIYEQDENESFIVGITNVPTVTLAFPAELGGKPVRNLFRYGAFRRYKWQEAAWSENGGYWQIDGEADDDWLSGVTKIEIPEGVTNICGSAFASTHWWDGAGVQHFDGWRSLKTVSLPDSLVSCVPDEAFGDTPFLRSKKFPDFILSASGKKLWGVKAYEGEESDGQGRQGGDGYANGGGRRKDLRQVRA